MFYVFFLALLIWFLSLIPSCSMSIPPPSAPAGYNDAPPMSKAAESENPCGAPIWLVDVHNQNLLVVDTPLWVHMPYGKSINFTLTYNAILSEDRTEHWVGKRWANSFSEYIEYSVEENIYSHYAGDGRVDSYLYENQSYKIDEKYLMPSETRFAGSLTVDGNEIDITYPTGEIKTFTLSSSGKWLISSLIDENGNQTTYHYTPDSERLSSITSPNGQSINISYSSTGMIETVSDSIGRTALLEYDDQLNLTAITDMEGYRATLDYDEETGYISAISDALGTTTFLIERGNGEENLETDYPEVGEPLGLSNRLTITDPLGNSSEYFYNSVTGKTWYVSPEHYVSYRDAVENNANQDVPKTIYSYTHYDEGYSRVADISYPDGSFISYQYDEHKNLNEINLSSGKKLTLTNDTNGNPIESINEVGFAITQRFNERNQLILRSTSIGSESYNYDEAGRIISVKDVNGHQTSYTYNEYGQLTTATNPLGHIKALEYNLNQQLASVMVDGTEVASFTYDSASRVATMTDLHGKMTHYTYNNIDTLTRVQGEGGRSVDRVYGSCPRVKHEETYADGRSYRFSYDADKNLASITDPMMGKTRVMRDKVGRITALIDANQNRTEFDFDVGGNLVTKRYNDASELSFTYDKGRLSTRTNARGTVKTYHYNLMGQLTSITYSDETPDITLTYDALGRIATITDQLGLTTYQFHNDGQLMSIDGHLENDTVAFEYDQLNRIRLITIDGVEKSQYHYDSLGRVASIKAFGELYNYDYRDSGADIGYSIEYPNGVVKNTEFDGAGDLSSIRYMLGENTISSFDYNVDLSGNITSASGNESLALPNDPYRATYNGLNQVVSWNGQVEVLSMTPMGI